MRKQFFATLHRLMADDKRIVLLLGGVGAWAARDIQRDYPGRCYDLGLREQAIIGMAAGMAKAGLLPVVYGIAPFFVERAFEQIKVDIGYNRMKVILVSVGASFDYAKSGATHHCPGDIATLYQVPGLRLVVPGTARELDELFIQAIEDDASCYFRLSEQVNEKMHSVLDGNGCALIGNSPFSSLIIAVGPALEWTLKAIGNMAVTVLYFQAIKPFDFDLVYRYLNGNKIFLVEPYYPVLAQEIMQAARKPVQVRSLGVPREFLGIYGTIEEQQAAAGLSPENIRREYLEFCK